MQHRKPRYRVLSMDGGPASPTYGRYLREIERRRPGFLAQADLFAGTSGGAGYVGFFAARARPLRDLETIEEALEFNERLFQALEPTAAGYARMASLSHSADEGERTAELLEWQFGDLTFAELTPRGSHAIMVSFRLKAPWGVKVFHNFGDDDPDHAERVSEGIHCSSAFPVLTAIRNGHVDGGVFANNPAMVALTQVMAYRDELDVASTDDMVMLSLGHDAEQIGQAEVQEEFEQEVLPWGVGQWLINPKAPGLLMEALINADSRGTCFQVRALLGSRFLRLASQDSSNVGGISRLLLGQRDETTELAERDAEEWVSGEGGHPRQATLQETLAWVDEHWMP